MKLEIVAVKDNALEAYGNPFYVHTLGQALRSFSDEVNRAGEDNSMHQHPEDYNLYHLGTFDSQTGRILNVEPQPVQIAIGKNLIMKRQ